ncbi:unnamed protein product [Notodromas monacha]|uniref:RNB domain-containing protein n=1 Tax=Notodromas monacha TaxID=399045 RepID=A0A7R9BKH2_9CRUS|nr:unnamed protein product [Notodromas monacha]CAG0916314.1 unnamed protein product [Notodromas monacha]
MSPQSRCIFLDLLFERISFQELAKRRDLRSHTICSVDPPGCTDIDDALHCRVLDNGNFEVGVHIADVSHFIRPNTAIDEEAAVRGTTVYLVDKRIDMVPGLLSSNLCSLRGNEERYAFSVIWEVTPEVEFVRTEAFKSIIKSSAALTYEQAQLKIDDPSLKDELTLGLRRLNMLAKRMRKKRAEAGETHDPVEVQVKKMLETNSMVEEWMLKANMTVAAMIYETFPECACLRRHPAPPVSSFEPVVKATNPRGFKIDVSSNKNLACSLDKAVVNENPYYNTMLRILTTRCMMQAVYFASGTIDYEEFYHYGLAAPIYTHFTSPIRRYADIIVHRLLAVTIGADSTYPGLTDKNRTQVICNNINYRHKMAQYAGRASVNLHTRMFFKGRVSEEDGYVLQIRKNALQVLVPKYGLEATLFLEGKQIDPKIIKFVYDESEPSQTCGSVKFSTFDKVVVQISIDESNVQREKLVLRLVHPKVPGFSVDPLPQKPK